MPNLDFRTAAEIEGLRDRGHIRAVPLDFDLCHREMDFRLAPVFACLRQRIDIRSRAAPNRRRPPALDELKFIARGFDHFGKRSGSIDRKNEARPADSIRGSRSPRRANRAAPGVSVLLQLLNPPDRSRKVEPAPRSFCHLDSTGLGGESVKERKFSPRS